MAPGSKACHFFFIIITFLSWPGTFFFSIKPSDSNPFDHVNKSPVSHDSSVDQAPPHIRSRVSGRSTCFFWLSLFLLILLSSSAATNIPICTPYSFQLFCEFRPTNNETIWARPPVCGILRTHHYLYQGAPNFIRIIRGQPFTSWLVKQLLPSLRTTTTITLVSR